MNIRLQTKITALALISIFCCSLRGQAQTQTVTFAVGYPAPVFESYSLTTNQVVKLLSVTSNNYGNYSNVCPSVTLYNSNGINITTTNAGDTFTGLTKISVAAGLISATPVNGMVTIEVCTPQSSTVISNYVPADAIVIPASATGNVQIILESSPDLVNWTAAEPGIYGPSATTNRFFRVRAVAN